MSTRKFYIDALSKIDVNEKTKLEVESKNIFFLDPDITSEHIAFQADLIFSDSSAKSFQKFAYHKTTDEAFRALKEKIAEEIDLSQLQENPVIYVTISRVETKIVASRIKQNFATIKVKTISQGERQDGN